ncbi:MAG: DNA-binding domain-containing protein [Betaproteobacteria bacterium]
MSASLLGLQGEFLACLHNLPHNFAALVSDAGPLSRQRRLQIYHHAYRARLVEVMQDVFERTWAYLGDDAFEACARGFIDAHPARDRTLNDFGGAFPAWLAERFPDDGEVAEIAMIDVMMRRAFDGADAVPLRIGELAARPPGDWATLGFAFHPTMAMAPAVFNAASLWDALEQGRAPPGAARLPDPLTLLVWRRDFRPHFRTIDSMEAAAIDHLCAGKSFARTGEMLAAGYPQSDVAAWLGGRLRQWLDEELLVGWCDLESGRGD